MSKEKNRLGFMLRKRKVMGKPDLNILGKSTTINPDITIKVEQNSKLSALSGLLKKPVPQPAPQKPKTESQPKLSTDPYFTAVQLDPLNDVKVQLMAGNKLEAVKIYKALSGKSLMDSKLAVEALMAQQPALNKIAANLAKIDKIGSKVAAQKTSSFTAQPQLATNQPLTKLPSKDSQVPVLSEAKIVAKTRVVNRESCREIYRDAKMHVVEYEPQVRVCKFHLYGQATMRYLSMPYMQFTRYLGAQGMSLHVSFTNKPLQSIQDDVYFVPLPNVWYPSGQVCLMSCPNGQFETVMKNFWNTRYLDCEDWYCFPVIEKETPMKSFQKWERMSADDPSFITKVQWTHSFRIVDIPRLDVGGDLNSKQFCKPEYGGSHTNRFAGPIRGFAVVPYHRHGDKVLD